MLASAGIAIGFAAQDILKNIFGGIMILFDRPFQVGDKVEIGQYYGESNCQVVAEFYLLPGGDLQEIRKLALRSASVSKYVYLRKPVVVIFKTESQMGQTRIKMRLKAYVLDVRYEFKFLSEMTENVLREFQERGIM